MRAQFPVSHIFWRVQPPIKSPFIFRWDFTANAMTSYTVPFWTTHNYPGSWGTRRSRTPTAQLYHLLRAKAIRSPNRGRPKFRAWHHCTKQPLQNNDPTFHIQKHRRSPTENEESQTIVHSTRSRFASARSSQRPSHTRYRQHRSSRHAKDPTYYIEPAKMPRLTLDDRKNPSSFG